LVLAAQNHFIGGDFPAQLAATVGVGQRRHFRRVYQGLDHFLPHLFHFGFLLLLALADVFKRLPPGAVHAVLQLDHAAAEAVQDAGFGKICGKAV
jgi:hypothetical protein